MRQSMQWGCRPAKQIYWPKENWYWPMIGQFLKTPKHCTRSWNAPCAKLLPQNHWLVQIENGELETFWGSRNCPLQTKPNHQVQPERKHVMTK